MLHVLKCEYVSGYKLELTFDNHTTGIADLCDLPKSGTVFEPLQDVEVFKNITLQYGGVTTWLDGKLDIAPEYLFFLANRTNLEYGSLFKEWGYIS